MVMVEQDLGLDPVDQGDHRGSLKIGGLNTSISPWLILEIR